MKLEHTPEGNMPLAVLRGFPLPRAVGPLDIFLIVKPRTIKKCSLEKVVVMDLALVCGETSQGKSVLASDSFQKIAGQKQICFQTNHTF